MINANFLGRMDIVRTKPVYQWDVNHKIKVSGLLHPDKVVGHFTNHTNFEAKPVTGAVEGGDLVLDIPNVFLQSHNDITLYLYEVDSDGARTIRTVKIPVIKREQPADYEMLPNAPYTYVDVSELKMEIRKDTAAQVSKAIAGIDIPDPVISDWNQNDENASDYIKNRPFYKSNEHSYNSKQAPPPDNWFVDGNVISYNFTFELGTIVQGSTVSFLNQNVLSTVSQTNDQAKFSVFSANVDVSGTYYKISYNGESHIYVPEEKIVDTSKDAVVLITNPAKREETLIITVLKNTVPPFIRTAPVSITYETAYTIKKLDKKFMPDEYMTEAQVTAKNYQTAEQVSTAVNNAIGGITGFSFEVVEALPETGEAGKIYLIADEHDENDGYDEYIWITDKYEKLGHTPTKLPNPKELRINNTYYDGSSFKSIIIQPDWKENSKYSNNYIQNRPFYYMSGGEFADGMQVYGAPPLGTDQAWSGGNYRLVNNTLILKFGYHDVFTNYKNTERNMVFFISTTDKGTTSYSWKDFAERYTRNASTISDSTYTTTLNGVEYCYNNSLHTSYSLKLDSNSGFPYIEDDANEYNAYVRFVFDKKNENCFVSIPKILVGSSYAGLSDTTSNLKVYAARFEQNVVQLPQEFIPEEYIKGIIREMVVSSSLTGK